MSVAHASSLRLWFGRREVAGKLAGDGFRQRDAAHCPARGYAEGPLRTADATTRLDPENED